MFLLSGKPCVIDDYSITNAYDGHDILEFEMSAKDPLFPLLVENAVVSEEQDYVVTQINGSGDSVGVTCMLDLRDFQGVLLEGYDNTSAKLEQTITPILPEDWAFVNEAGNNLYRTVRVDYGTAADVLESCRKLYGVEFRYDNRAKIVTAVDPSSYTLSAAFVTEQLNLRKLQYYGDSTALITRLKCRGKEGLTFANINGGKDYVENTEYSDRVIWAWWVDERYTDAESLLADAKEKIAELSAPVRSYECDVVDLREIEPDKYSAQDMSLYNVVSLKDIRRGTEHNYQVVERVRYPHYPQRNVVTLSTAAPKLQSKLQELEYEIASIEIPENVVSEEYVNSAVANATSWITGNQGGYLFFRRNPETGQPEEFIILDTDAIGTAKNVWRWNMGGLGFSPNGYEGPYTTAITQDGSIVADFITAGRFEVRDADDNVTFFADADTGEVSINATSVKIGLGDVASAMGELESATNQNRLDIEANASGITSIATNLQQNYSTTEQTQTIISQTANSIEQSVMQIEEKLEQDYSTTEEVSSLISQSASSIEQSVTESVTTNIEGKFPTTEQVESLISQSADSIEQSVTETVTGNLEGKYATTEQVQSLISQSAESIEQSVTQSVTTHLDENYSTTEEVGSLISQSATAIEQSVSNVSKNLEDNYSTTTETQSMISQTATAIEQTVSNVSQNLENNYSTTSEMNSAISQTASAIEQSVAANLQNYSTTSQMNSAISQSANAIQQSVSADLQENYLTSTQTQTLINQSADAIELSVTQTVTQNVGDIAEEIASETVSAELGLYVKKNDNNQIVSMLNASANDINITGDRIKISSEYFNLSYDGEITAESGTIGGFSIDDTSIYSGSAGSNDIVIDSDTKKMIVGGMELWYTNAGSRIKTARLLEIIASSISMTATSFSNDYTTYNFQRSTFNFGTNDYANFNYNGNCGFTFSAASRSALLSALGLTNAANTPKIQSGTVSVALTSGKGDKMVTFTSAFSSAPHVTVSAVGNNASAWIAKISDVTASGFRAIVVHSGGSATQNVTVHWIAVL